ncbi:MAG: hypothetical protein ACRDWH_04325 [Acidimicrobiia bacterium]
MGTIADAYFEFSPTDRSMALLDRISPVTFHVIWDLAGPLELAALAQSWQTLAAVHPILACTVDVSVDTSWHPRTEPLPWRLVEIRGEQVEDLTVREVRSPLDLAGSSVRLTALAARDRVRLILAAHHAAFDGVASVLLIEDLRRIYRDLISPAGRSTLPTDDSPRTVAETIRRTGLPVPEQWAVATRSLDRWRRQPPSTHAAPSPKEPAVTAAGYETIDLGPALKALDERRRRDSWPVDAMLVGVLESAWAEVFGPGGPGSSVWLVASDIRPALGITGGVGNLSGAEPVAIERPGQRPVSRVIEQAAAAMATWKSGFPGLGPELMARTWSWLPPTILNQGVEKMIRTGQRLRHTRTLSNVGRLPASISDWGPVAMDRIHFLGPMSRGPYTSFVAFSHGSSSLLTTRTSPDWLTSSHVTEFRKAIDACAGLTA